MSHVFVIQNQDGHYLNKQQEWVDGSDRRTLYRTKYRDEAVNVVFEHSSKDIYLRAQPLECEVDDNNQPIVKAGPPIFAPLADEDEDDSAPAENSEDALATLQDDETDLTEPPLT
jgi:hypothetical protein